MIGKGIKRRNEKRKKNGRTQKRQKQKHKEKKRALLKKHVCLSSFISSSVLARSKQEMD